MQFVQNFPFITIILSLFSGPLSSILDGKKAKRVNFAVISAITVMSFAVLMFAIRSGTSYVYTMGHFPAPWGNEIRVGVLEAFMAVFFCVVMLLCIIGGVYQSDPQRSGAHGNRGIRVRNCADAFPDDPSLPEISYPGSG